MPFEPCANNGVYWKPQDEPVEHPWTTFEGEPHPPWKMQRIRSRVDETPEYTHHNNRKHGDSKRFVELPIEIASGPAYLCFLCARDILIQLPTFNGASGSARLVLDGARTRVHYFEV